MKTRLILISFRDAKSLNKYTQKYCFKFCYQKLIIQQCNCSNIQYVKFNIGDSRPCLSMDELLCVLETDKLFFQMITLRINANLIVQWNAIPLSTA